jgi:hypothetical protein
MAGGATFYTAGEILDFILRAVAPSIPATVYLRLLTTPSTRGTSGTESTYGAYARLPLVRGTALFTDPVLTGRSANVDPFVFPSPSSPGDPIVAFDIVDTPSGAVGTTYLFGAVSPARSITVGKAIRFPAGALEVTA